MAALWRIDSRRQRWLHAVALTLWILPASVGTAEADPLGGSASSLQRQVQSARRNDFTLLETAADVRRFVSLGLLVPIEPNFNFQVHGASFPVARPELKTFVERLALQYRRACGEKLVVTSLTRPASRQPRNGYRRSVHRAGMAVDLRRSRRPGCRQWLEGTLRALEARGVLEATRERKPPHYHVAVFPRRYAKYVAQLTEDRNANSTIYVVRRGDTLWDIAREHDVPVERLRQANALERASIRPGRTLRIPGADSRSSIVASQSVP